MIECDNIHNTMERGENRGSAPEEPMPTTGSDVRTKEDQTASHDDLGSVPESAHYHNATTEEQTVFAAPGIDSSDETGLSIAGLIGELKAYPRLEYLLAAIVSDEEYEQYADSFVHETDENSDDTNMKKNPKNGVYSTERE